MMMSRAISVGLNKKLGIVVLGSLAMALSATMSFPLPGSPVPISMQSFMAIFLGLTFGPHLAMYSIFLYLLEGALGLPVFALGRAGIHILFGETGGYLFGLIPAAVLSGFLQQKWQKSTLLVPMFAGLLGHIIILSSGFFWPSLRPFAHSWHQLFAIGIIPFLPGTVVKVLMLVGVSSLKKLNLK